jgi:hypothetical protein
MGIQQLVPAETGWKAVFSEPDGGESLSRILVWATVTEGGDDSVVGLIVDPSSPSEIIPAPEAFSPDGGSFVRYRYVAPERPQIVVTQPEPPPTDTAEEVAKTLIKRRR